MASSFLLSFISKASYKVANYSRKFTNYRETWRIAKWLALFSRRFARKVRNQRNGIQPKVLIRDCILKDSLILPLSLFLSNYLPRLLSPVLPRSPIRFHLRLFSLFPSCSLRLSLSLALKGRINRLLIYCYVNNLARPRRHKLFVLVFTRCQSKTCCRLYRNAD